jgi:hypothetical protein
MIHQLPREHNIHVYTLGEGLITSLKIFEDTGLVVSAMHPD